MRKEAIRTFSALDLVQLRAADAAIADLHENLAEGEFARQLHAADHQRVALLDQNRRFHRSDLHGLFEINKLVVAAVAEMIEYPNPLIRVEKRFRRQSPAL